MATKTKRPLRYWIKQRNNPQIGTYYVALGQLSQRDANKHKQSIYGTNAMLSYSTEELYKEFCEALQARPCP